MFSTHWLLYDLVLQQSCSYYNCCTLAAGIEWKCSSNDVCIYSCCESLNKLRKLLLGSIEKYTSGTAYDSSTAWQNDKNGDKSLHVLQAHLLNFGETKKSVFNNEWRSHRLDSKFVSVKKSLNHFWRLQKYCTWDTITLLMTRKRQSFF